MSPTDKERGVVNKASDESINHKRKVSLTGNSVIGQVKKTRRIDPTAALVTRLTAYKLACDIPRYGLTTEMAKKMIFIDLSTHAQLVSVQNVMNNFIRNIVLIALDVTENQQKRTLDFIESTNTSFVGFFVIAYHPLECFKQINESQRERNETAIEMLRLFENLWSGITNISPGANCAFKAVARDAGIFVRFLQGYIDQHEFAVEKFKTRYKTSINIMYRLQLDPEIKINTTMMLRCETQERMHHDHLKKIVGNDAIKIIEEHRTAFLKEHGADKLLNAPPRCAPGFDGELSRRLH